MAGIHWGLLGEGERAVIRGLVGGCFALGLIGITSPALAHNVVEDRIPSPDSIITISPVEISIATNDMFLDLGGEAGGFGLVMVDDNGLYYGDGCVLLNERRMGALVDLGPRRQCTPSSINSCPLMAIWSQKAIDVDFQPDNAHIPAQGYPDAPECGVDREAPEDITALAESPELTNGDAPTESPSSTDDALEGMSAPSGVAVGIGILATVAATAIAIALSRKRRD